MCKMITCFFIKDTATHEIYTLSLHDALPIKVAMRRDQPLDAAARGLFVPREDEDQVARRPVPRPLQPDEIGDERSEEHTSELQSPCNLVCRLLLEKKDAT